MFFDPSGWRKYFFAAANWFTASLVGVAVGCLILTVFVTPNLPSLKPPVAQKTALALAMEPVGDPMPNPDLPREAGAVPAPSVLRYGYLVNWDDNSFSSLRRHAGELDVLIMEWLHAVHPGGALDIDDPDQQRAVLGWIRKHAPGLSLMPLVNNYNSGQKRWDKEATTGLLHSAEARATFARALLRYAKAMNADGLVLDFEQFAPADREKYTVLVREVASRFRAHGMKLLVAARLEPELYQLDALAEASNGVILMTYDEHTEDGNPGPLAAQGWFEKQVAEAVAQTGPAKLIVSIGSYGYDWNWGRQTRDISVQEAWELLDEIGTNLKFDSVALNPSFLFTDESDGSLHQVWYLDAVTGYNQIGAALAHRPAGLALWRLGTEDGALWAVFGRGQSFGPAALPGIGTIPFGYDILYSGRGEILSVTGTREDGKREITYDKHLGLITGQAISKYPKATTVRRWGRSAEKLVALTFDDGPDPQYTPRILDILSEKGAKATFFIVGANGTLHRDLLKRIYAEGHDLGNHTFTHINTSVAPTYQLQFELNATRRLLEATVGAGTALFRPEHCEIHLGRLQQLHESTRRLPRTSIV